MVNSQPAAPPDGPALPRATEHTFKTPSEKLEMDKYHMLFVLERLTNRPTGVSFEQVCIPGALFLGSLLQFIPGGLPDASVTFLGASAATWSAFALFVIFGSGATTLLLLMKWWRDAPKRVPQTSEDQYNKIIQMMQEDRKKYANPSLSPAGDGLQREGPSASQLLAADLTCT